MEMDQLYLERETSEPDPVMWRWSPLELTVFDHMLTVARQVLGGLQRLRFAEAGSGIGTKLYLAKFHHGLDVTGYEISDDYLQKASCLDVDAIKMDLREVSPAWSMFDIVYIARPFKDDAFESEWEQSVMDGMRPGAVLISAYAAVKPYTWQCYDRGSFRGVWQKPRSAPVYNAMIERQEPHDPLVTEPSLMLDRHPVILAIDPETAQRMADDGV